MCDDVLETNVKGDILSQTVLLTSNTGLWNTVKHKFFCERCLKEGPTDTKSVFLRERLFPVYILLVSHFLFSKITDFRGTFRHLFLFLLLFVFQIRDVAVLACSNHSALSETFSAAAAASTQPRTKKEKRQN